MRFSYAARKQNGESVTGAQEAPDARALAASLRSEGLIPVSISEVSAQTIFAGARRQRGGGRPRLADIAPFMRQLSVMLRAGVSLVTALDDLSKQIDKPSFARVVEDLRNRVTGGSPLSVAMKTHPRVLTPLMCALVRAGEESGRLEQVTADLASYLESQISLRRQVSGALVYPAFVAGFFAIAFVILFVFLIPRFQGIYSGLGEQLPLLTTIALAVSVWLRHWLPVVVAVIVGGVLAVRIASHFPRMRARLDRVLIGLPVIGELSLKIVLVRFLETLATLQRSGVSILMSLDIARETAGNKVVEDALGQARMEVMRGSFLSRELAKSKVFPRMLVRMVAVGEETGNTEELLTQTATFYKEEVNTGIQAATRLIEPTLIVLMGIVIAIFLLAVYLPIFKLAGALH